MNADGYASVEDYLSEFRDLLERELPEQLPGSSATSKMIGEYMARDKRTILLFIKTGPDTVLTVRYKMPVPSKGAKLFGLPHGLVAHEQPVFGAITQAEIPARIAAAEAAKWDTMDEYVQSVALDDSASDIRRRSARHLLVYWRRMRELLFQVYQELGILAPHARSSSRSTTLSAGGTEPRAHTPRPNSDPRSSSTRTLSYRASNSNRTARSSSRRRVSRRRSDPARVGPRRFSGKPTSDPTRRRRRRSV